MESRTPSPDQADRSDPDAANAQAGISDTGADDDFSLGSPVSDTRSSASISPSHYNDDVGEDGLAEVSDTPNDEPLDCPSSSDNSSTPAEPGHDDFDLNSPAGSPSPALPGSPPKVLAPTQTQTDSLSEPSDSPFGPLHSPAGPTSPTGNVSHQEAMSAMIPLGVESQTGSEHLTAGDVPGSNADGERHGTKEENETPPDRSPQPKVQQSLTSGAQHSSGLKRVETPDVEAHDCNVELDYGDDDDLHEASKFPEPDSSQQTKVKVRNRDDDDEEEEGELESSEEDEPPPPRARTPEEKEEGEIDDGRVYRVPQTCRFFAKGLCTWGRDCRFLHPGVNDKGSYRLIGPPGSEPQPGNEEDGENESEAERENSPEPMPQAPVKPETPWERGLRQAKEALKKASRKKEMELDIEDKKMNLSLNDVENKENEKKHRDPYYDSMQYDELDPIQATDLGDYAEEEEPDVWEVYRVERAAGPGPWPREGRPGPWERDQRPGPWDHQFDLPFDPPRHRSPGSAWHAEPYDRRMPSRDRFERPENRTDRDRWLHDKYEGDKDVRKGRRNEGGAPFQREHQKETGRDIRLRRPEPDRMPRRDAGLRRQAFGNNEGWVDPWQRSRDKNVRQRRRSSSNSSFSSRSSRSSSSTSFSSRSRSRTRTPTPLRNISKPDRAEAVSKSASTQQATKKLSPGRTSPGRGEATRRRPRVGPEWATAEPVKDKELVIDIPVDPPKESGDKPAPDKPSEVSSTTPARADKRSVKAGGRPNDKRRRHRSSSSSSSSDSSSGSSSSDSDSSSSSSSSSSDSSSSDSSSSDDGSNASDELYAGLAKRPKNKHRNRRSKITQPKGGDRKSGNRKGSDRKPTEPRSHEKHRESRQGPPSRRPALSTGSKKPDIPIKYNAEAEKEKASNTVSGKGSIKLTLVNKKLPQRKRVLDSPPPDPLPPTKKAAMAPPSVRDDKLSTSASASKDKPRTTPSGTKPSSQPPAKSKPATAPTATAAKKAAQPNRRDELLKQLKAVEDAIAKKRQKT